jgi:hypothetical protein
VAFGVTLLALGVLHFELWRCPVAELLRVPCPGCGMTRAALALISGDVAGALRWQPLSPVIVPLAAAFAAHEMLAFVRFGRARPERPLGPWSRRALATLVALLIGVWIARFFGAFGGPVRVSSHLLGRAAESPATAPPSPASARLR